MAKKTVKNIKNKKAASRKQKKPSVRKEITSLFKQPKKSETARFIIGLVLICVSLFLIVSFVSFLFTAKQDATNLSIINHIETGEITEVANTGGILGLRAANYFMNHGFGFTAILIPVFMLLVSLKLMNTHAVRIIQQFINLGFLMIWGSTTLAYFFPNPPITLSPGGSHGIFIKEYLINNTGDIGLLMILFVTIAIFFIYLTRKTIDFLRRIMHVEKPIKNLRDSINSRIHSDSEEKEDTKAAQEPEPNKFNEDEGPLVIDLSDNDKAAESEQEPAVTIDLEEVEQEEEPIELIIDTPEEEDKEDIEDEEDFERGSLSTPYDPKLDFEYYNYPSVSLLKKYPEQDSSIDMQEQQANKDRIVNVLRNFGVEISSIKATVGPTITLYEITPAKGVRIAKIRNLEDDIALSLSAIGIRIIAPIPGKGTIGIEVPNAKPKIVSMESVINSRKFQECDYELPIALGRTITNEIYIQDLAKMPHLLVAGATGQGKSVGLNAIISSLLFKKHPTELKFVLVDPKKVEFSVYAPLENNFMAEVAESEGEPVITDMDKVKHTLKSLCQEMDDRYLLLQKSHCRNITEYNEKFKSRRLNPEHGHRFLPYIVVIIDEFGDLIMVAGKEIEHPITRIAQLARAVGIHMVIATQRPTTNIITGNIKANFPARMAFRVMAAVDSRTILDQMGANQLVGKGDMLFLAAGKQVERVQCAFIDTPEVEAVNAFISEQHSPLRAYELPEVQMSDEDYGDNAMDGDGRVSSYDSMFVDVARYVVNGQQGSTSAIQRTFSIGYNRAGRLMDQLEKAKIVGPARGAKPREVLILDEADLNAKLQLLNLI